ncbi:MAG: OsmC family protein [Bacteroidota bacterium]
MYVEVKKVGAPFLMEITNSDGNSCLMDAGPNVGGTSKGLRPMELLAGALAGCISIDVLNILRKQKQELTHYRVRIEETKREGTPSPFEKLHLIFEVNDAIDPINLGKQIKLVKDKYCSVSESLRDEIIITFEVVLISPKDVKLV